MRLHAEPLKRSDYIVTTSGNKIAKSAVISGSQHISLGGMVIVKPGAVIAGDLYSNTIAGPKVAISIDSYSIIETGAKLQPPHITLSSGDSLLKT